MRRACLIALLIVACDAPARVAAPEPEPESEPAPEPDPSPVDALAHPAPLSDDDLASVSDELAARARSSQLGEAEFRQAGPWLVEEQPTRPLISPQEMDTKALEEYPPLGERGEPARVNPRLFRREPSASIGPDGSVEVQFETTREIASASVYYGTELLDDPFGTARLRRREGELHRSDSKMSMVFSVWRILGRRHDITDVRERGRGMLRWRLEALDTEAGTARVYDSRLGFRCEPVPCEDDARIVQLPTVRLGPFVDLVSHERATVTVETDVDTVAELVVSDGAGEVTRVASAGGGRRHELRVEGLEADTRHRYVVLVADARGEVGASRSATFRTWPTPEDDTSLRFAVLSDSRSGHGTSDEQYAGTNREVLDDLLRRAVEEGARFVVFVGDLIDGYRTHAGSYRYELEAWQRASEPVHASIPIYEAVGNHEALMDYWTAGWAVAQTGDVSAEGIFAERFVNPDNGPEPAEGAPPFRENVFSFDAGPAHLAIVNSNYFWRSHAERDDHPAYGRGQREGWIDDRQLEWLEADLASVRDGAHIYVFTHEPGYPNGGHTQDGMWWRGIFGDVVERRARFFGLMADHEVEAIFHGDEHNYSRTRVHEGLSHPMWQIISGGAGAPYYAQDLEMPWVEDVATFDGRQHLVIVDVDGDEATGRAVSRTGETIDRFALTQ